MVKRPSRLALSLIFSQRDELFKLEVFDSMVDIVLSGKDTAKKEMAQGDNQMLKPAKQLSNCSINFIKP